MYAESITFSANALAAGCPLLVWVLLMSTRAWHQPFWAATTSASVMVVLAKAETERLAKAMVLSVVRTVFIKSSLGIREIEQNDLMDQHG
jgi:hypothetical protein